MKPFKLLKRLIIAYLITGLALALPTFLFLTYGFLTGADTGIITVWKEGVLMSFVLMLLWPQMVADDFRIGHASFIPDYALIILFSLLVIYAIVKTVREARD